MSEAAKLSQEQFSRCSPLAQKITMALQKEDFLHIPASRRGWGMAVFVDTWVAELIDKTLSEASKQPKQGEMFE